jgi:hypothetical protein
MVSLQWRNLRGKEYLLNGLLNDTDFYASKQRHNGGKTQGEFHHLQCFTAEWQCYTALFLKSSDMSPATVVVTGGCAATFFLCGSCGSHPRINSRAANPTT